MSSLLLINLLRWVNLRAWSATPAEESSEADPEPAGRRMRSGLDQLKWCLKSEQSIFIPIRSYFKKQTKKKQNKPNIFFKNSSSTSQQVFGNQFIDSYLFNIA